MRVIIVGDEFPYPVNHGGKVDAWNRIIAFKELGCEIFYITWVKNNEQPSDKHLSQVANIVDDIEIIPYPSKAKRIVRMFKYPSLVTARVFDAETYENLLHRLKSFCADFVFIDRIYAGVAGLQIGSSLSLPVSLRLHNIEHQYIKGQFLLAKSFYSKLQLFAAGLHLRRYENWLIKKVDHFFDISISGLQYWESLGYKHGYWLPPIYLDTHNSYAPSGTQSAYTYDICFFGNLYSANNVDGLVWFVSQVLPLILTLAPGASLLIMGSNPVPEVSKLANANNVAVIANPKKFDQYLIQSNILINPTRFSSGVNIKTVEMLFKHNQVVSTTAGIAGLPAEIDDAFYVADTPADFAKCITDIIMEKKQKKLEKRNNLKSLFDSRRLQELVPIMASKRPNNH